MGLCSSRSRARVRRSLRIATPRVRSADLSDLLLGKRLIRVSGPKLCSAARSGSRDRRRSVVAMSRGGATGSISAVPRMGGVWVSRKPGWGGGRTVGRMGKLSIVARRRVRRSPSLSLGVSHLSSSFKQVPSMLFQGSLLLGLISRAYLGYTTMHAATVSIHPLVIAGWCGLTTTAFNMLPVGCLDGGRAMQGAFGKDALAGFSLATYLMLGLGVLGGPLSLPWGIYVLICQRSQEKACLNDVSEVGTWRKAAVVGVTFLVLFTLVPVWDELAEEIGIGLVNILL